MMIASCFFATETSIVKTDITPVTKEAYRPHFAKEYVCPKNVSKLCEAYGTIQMHYIKSLSDDELTQMFIRGIEQKTRETDLSKPASPLVVHPASFTCSPNLQKLCDAYDTVQNRYGRHIPDKALTDMFINGVIGVINETDPYSKYFSTAEKQKKAFEYSGVGLDMKKEETFPFHMIVRVSKEYNPAYIAGIRRGDRITHVDGIAISGKTARETITLIRGKAGTPVELTIISGCSGKIKTYTLIRKDTRDVLSGTIKALDGGIGYVRLAEFDQGTMIRIRTSIELYGNKYGRMKGLILGLRNNPGGSTLEASKLLGLFIEKGTAFYYMKQNGKYFSWDIRSYGRDILQGIPIVVLVNDDSASSSEITAGALQDFERATIVGTGTYGKGCFQTKFTLKDGSILELTEASTFTPKQKPISKVGIKPDVFVTEGKNESCTGDEQLSTAIRILSEKI